MAANLFVAGVKYLFVALEDNDIWNKMIASKDRGVITQPFWHVRFPRGTLEGAFGSSATTGGLHFCYCTRLSVHQFFFGVIEKFSPLLYLPHRKSKKTEISAAKHIYTSVGSPLWSQNFQKRPLSHRVGTLNAYGSE
jgi:hypothetical protein